MVDVINAATYALNADLTKLQAASQNLTNMNTTGFKREIMVDHGFQSLVATPNTAADTGQHVVRGLEQGALKSTGNPQDIAIEGDGFLPVQKDGQELYTRRGQLMVDAQGYLALKSGERVQGASGAIPLEGTDYTIKPNGDVMQNGRVIDRIHLESFSGSSSLQYVGDGLFRAKSAGVQVTPEKTHLVQGYLEASNVKMMDEMVNLIQITRHFEMTHQVLTAYDGAMDTAISVLGNF